MNRLAPLALRCWRSLARLAHDNRGVSAVEFAFIFPIMLSLYITGNELAAALSVDRKVTHATSSVADLVAQVDTVSSTDMTGIMDAASAIVGPWDKIHLRTRISFLTIDSTGHVKVTWSKISNYTQTHDSADEPLIVAYPTNTVLTTLPAGVIQNSTYLVMAEVHYYYTPPIFYYLTGTFDLTDTFYLRPRISDTITAP